MSTSLQLAKDLWKQLKKQQQQNANNSHDLEPHVCVELLTQLQEQADSKQIPLHKMDTFRNTLVKAQKTFRVQKRAAESDDKQEWEDLLQQTKRLISTLKQLEQQLKPSAASDNDSSNNDGANAKEKATDDTSSLPTSRDAYLSRLQRQKKELYKNPPVLPPAKVTIETDYVALPKRNKTNGELTFVAGQDQSLQELLNDFHPNSTPEEVLRGGAFGGTYFRTIVSAVTNQTYTSNAVVKDTLPKEWIDGLDAKLFLTSNTYRNSVNKFKSKCGGSLGMWESSGWIADTDPYGWFQWYCRFYQGRRSSDDARQIARWKGVAGLKGRFRSQLCNKILAANTKADDTRISPVIRQTLFHWGLLITEDIVKQHQKRTGK